MIMTIDELREHKWIVPWSGGKDSTATILKMLEYKVPIERIVYVRMMWDAETPATLPVMTEFVDHAIEKLNEFGCVVDVVKTTPIKELSLKVYHKSKYEEKQNKPYGMAAFMRGHCKAQGIKENTSKQAYADNKRQMLGYAADETKRLHRLDDKTQSILVTLNIAEQECFDICRQHGLLSPLYGLGLGRDGCWFCPNARERERDASQHKTRFIQGDFRNV